MYVMGLISQGDRPVSSRSVPQTDVFSSVCDGIPLLFLCSPHSCSNHRSRFHISVYDGFTRRYEYDVRPVTSYFRNVYYIGLMGSFILGSAVRTLKFEDMSIENVETDKY